MIAYRDFHFQGPSFIPSESRDRENFDGVVAQVNQWIVREAIDVINVETHGVNRLDNLRVIRVWHRATGSKPDLSPKM